MQQEWNCEGICSLAELPHDPDESILDACLPRLAVKRMTTGFATSLAKKAIPRCSVTSVCRAQLPPAGFAAASVTSGTSARSIALSMIARASIGRGYLQIICRTGISLATGVIGDVAAINSPASSTIGTDRVSTLAHIPAERDDICVLPRPDCGRHTVGICDVLSCVIVPESKDQRVAGIGTAMLKAGIVRVN